MAELSRQELVNWVNITLQLNISKVDECGKGFVFCQLLDSIFRDIPMGRVKFKPANEYEYLNNFKILQAGFISHNIDRPIPIERLVKCRLQDNLEFLQWFKHYWDCNYPGHSYDPVARRGSNTAKAQIAGVLRQNSNAVTSIPNVQSKPLSTAKTGPNTKKPFAVNGDNLSCTKKSSKSLHTSTPLSVTSLGGRKPITNSKPLSTKVTKPSDNDLHGQRKPGNMYRNPKSVVVTAVSNTARNGTNQQSQSTPSPNFLAEQEQLRHELEEVKTHCMALEHDCVLFNEQLDLVTTEREFYFKKLRSIEIMVQTISDLMKQNHYHSARSIMSDHKHGVHGNSDHRRHSNNNSDSEDFDQETLELTQPDNIIRAIAEILYSTEAGFESPGLQSIIDEEDDDDIDDLNENINGLDFSDRGTKTVAGNDDGNTNSKWSNRNRFGNLHLDIDVIPEDDDYNEDIF